MGKWKKEENEVLESIFSRTTDRVLTPQLLGQLHHALPGRTDAAIRGKWSAMKTRAADKLADEEEAASVLPQILALWQNQTSHGPSKSKEELEEEAEEELEEEEEEETVKSPSKRPRPSSFSLSSSSSSSSVSSSSSFCSAMSPSARPSFVPSSVPLNAWLWYCCSKDGAYFFFRELPGVSYTLQRLPRRYEKLLVTIRRSRLTEEELSFIHIFSGLTQASAAWQQNNHQLELQETITLPNDASDPQLWRFEIKEGLEATFVPFMKDQMEEQQIVFFY